jgi:ribonuclease BN (tRNA processing enzyme)
LLLFDGQFSRATYPAAAGWGHSAWEDAVNVARATGARRLLVIHHAPESPDSRLDAVERDVAAALAGARLAREGMDVAV